MMKIIKMVFKQSSEERMRMMLEGNILQTFLFLSIPGILMVFIQAAMPVLDGLFVYNYDNAVSGAAISYTSSLQNVLIMGAMGLSSAGSAIIGQTRGGGDKEQAKKLAGQLVALTTFLGIILIPITIFIGYLMIASMEAELKSKIFIYNNILALSFPFMLAQSSFNTVKNVFGHPETTFIRTLIFVPLKLFYTFLFVAWLRMGIAGAALSGLCAYASIMFFIVYDLFIKNSEEKLSFKDLKITKNSTMRYLKVSWPAMIQSSLKSFGFLIIKLQTAAYGDIALSGQGIANDVSSMFQSFTCCYDSAIVPFVSINVGAGNGNRAKEAAYLAIKIGLVSSVILSLLSILAAPGLVNLYTKDPAITEIAVRGCYIMAAGFSGFSIMFNEMPAYIGLGLNKPSLFIQTIRIWVIRLIALYATYFIIPGIGVYAIFISFTICNLAGGLISHLIFRKVSWKKRI